MGPERKIPNIMDVRYDQWGNSFEIDRIGEVTIVNVPESMRFLKPESLSEVDRKQLLDLLHETRAGASQAEDDLHAGVHFAACLSPGMEGTVVPAEVCVGLFKKAAEGLALSGEILISFHGLDEQLNPKIIGFEITEEPSAQMALTKGRRQAGTILTPERYRAVKKIIGTIPREQSIPHPGTKEFMRRGRDFQETAEAFKAADLTEISGGMFKLVDSREMGKEAGDWILTAVHPFYLEYHNAFGQRDQLTSESREELMTRYEHLFAEHKGPLVIVEEQSKILDTLARIKKVGRRGDTYFVLTQDRDSSLFPYTNNIEFMDLLRDLGTENLKFVGGHDAGDKPYSSFDPATGRTAKYSGCLRGLANRIEKMGFPKIETMPGFTYS